MTITLNGTSGIVNDATNLSYTGTLTGSTGVVNIGSGQVYKDASGNFGLGTTAPAVTLDTRSTSAAAARFSRSGTSGQLTSIVFEDGSATLGSGGTARIASSTGYLAFSTGGTSGDTAGGTERARIDSSGNLLVGTTTVTTGKLNVVSATAVAGDFYVSGTSLLSTPTLYLEKADNNTTTSNVFVKFTVNATATGSGQINANGANAAAFGAFSDRRLKENITDLPSQLANIMALRPVEYDYIESEGGGHQIGFVAQEVQAVYPDLIGERDDGMLTLSDMNKNDARLIKCIQEQQALITALTTRITALEAQIV